MAHQPVGSGASIALTTDTANTKSSGIAQKSDTLRVVLVGADAVQGAHVAVGTDASATTASYYVAKNVPASIILLYRLSINILISGLDPDVIF